MRITTLSALFLACSPAVRNIDAKEAAALKAQTEGEALQGAPADGPAPVPPAKAKAPSFPGVTREKFEEGPELCLSTRPDFAEVFVSLELGGLLPPEERLLLQAWIQTAWREEMGSVKARWFPPECERHFLCVAVAEANATDVVGSLLEAASSPSTGAFYKARLASLETAGEWDRTSADWKLNTAARAVRAHSPGTERLKNLESIDESALRQVVEAHAGEKKASKLPLYALEKLVKPALRQSKVSVSGPTLGANLLSTLREKWKTPDASAPGEQAPLDAPTLPVLLEKDAPDLTQAILVWELAPDASGAETRGALTLLAQRWRSKEKNAARVRVQPAGGLYALPALRVEGPHEAVVATVSALAEEFDRFVSTYGAPSDTEWEEAMRRAPPSPHFETRCVKEAGSLAGIESMNAAREALRRAGPPTTVIWGTETAPPPSE